METQLPVVESGLVSKACGLVEAHDAVLEVDMDEAIVSGVGRRGPSNEAIFRTIHGGFLG